MSFGLYLIAFLLPPLYFLLRGKWLGFAINLTIWLISIPLLFVFGLGVLVWLIAVMHAMWHVRRELIEEHATTMAKHLAEQMAKQNQPR
jgi:hypothetical protein